MSDADQPVVKKSLARRAVAPAFKIVIAILGIWFVIHNLAWSDTGVLPKNGRAIREVTFLEDVTVTVEKEFDAPSPLAVLPGKGAGTMLASMRHKNVQIRFPSRSVHMLVEGHDVTMMIDETAVVPGLNQPLNLPRVMVIDEEMLQPIKVAEAGQAGAQAQGGAADGERIHEGLHSLLIHASGRWYLLLGAWLLLLIPFFVTAIRWRALLVPQGIKLPVAKCLELTFVGQFYSIMLPGITGGDLVKIIYAARLTGSKTKSLITVLLDRVMGLLALMTIALLSAGLQLAFNHQAGRPTDVTLLNVFLLIVVLLGGFAVCATVYFSARLRKLVGIDWFMTTFAAAGDPETAHLQHDKLEKLYRAFNLLVMIGAFAIGATAAILRWETHLAFVQQRGVLFAVVAVGMLLVGAGAAVAQVLHSKIVDRLMPVMAKVVGLVINVDGILHTYRGHFGLLIWAFMISLPSQLTLPLSAWLSGLAFGMTANVGYYLAYVPVAVLAASLPVSPPQGFGVMDWILFHFFVERGSARAGQAFALAQAIRFLPILWNLFGGYWVVTGSYSREKVEAEAREVEGA